MSMVYHERKREKVKKTVRFNYKKLYNMSLFILLTIITFIDAYKSRLINWGLKLLPQDSKIRNLSSEIHNMELELNKISMVNEFAKHVKLQRKINKLQEEKKEIAKEKAFQHMKIRYALITASYIVIIGSLITLVWNYRSDSVVQVPAQWLWPIASIFDWSYHIPGSITVPCWLAISSSASKTISKHF